MFVELCDYIGKLAVYLVVIQLAGTGIRMSAAAVGEAQGTDIGSAVLVDDGFADHDGSVLLLESPSYVNAHLYFRPHRIYHEPVASVDRLQRS